MFSKNVALKIFMTWLIKKFKKNIELEKMSKLKKLQIRAYTKKKTDQDCLKVIKVLCILTKRSYLQ